MKQLYIFLLASCMLLSLNSIAQTPDSTIAIPNPSFEEWSTGSGYSVTVYYFPLSIYDSYTYPTGWDYPTYPVNENITYSGLNVNVNTNVPLLKVSNVTSGAPDGSHALKLQSFMLSDLINPLVYNLAESSLDPMLTASFFPTVLSTGVVDIDHLLPLMDNITSNLGDLSQLVSLLSSVDMNTIVTGGLPLNGATPDRLSGYYKYTSAAGGDNIQELTKRFIQLVLREDRENTLQFMAASYITLYRQQKNITRGKLITATAVSPETEQKTKQMVESRTQGTVEFQTEVNPEIIGGFILEYDTYRMDASVQTKLRNILTQLKK